jgi:ribosomal 50S subunit-associated protein YjgA (DUF615 family)
MGKKKTRFQWDSETADEWEEDLPSRRQLKQEDNKLKVAVKELLSLRPELWSQLPLGESLREALEEARALKKRGNVKGALRRQTNRVSTLLRQDDFEAIQEALTKLKR